jgi:nitrile hydratase subunit beta
VNGVHDMGGMEGMGLIAPESDEPLFHEPWEARALALTLALGAWGRWTLDESRHQRELIPAPDYLRMSYYEKWITSLEDLAVKHGLITEGELASATPASPDKADPPLKAAWVAESLARGGPSARPAHAPARFAIGAAVRARNLNPAGHTRLPRYVRGKAGRVIADHGAHVFPDANAHGLGEQPQRLYTVVFTAAELWGPDARFAGDVRLDLWESYLEPA